MSNREYRPTLSQLRTFVTIAENKHFGLAASKLNISQPSLSQALVALEQGLNVQLIERSTRRVIVTPAGAKLFPLAKATLEAADNFLAQAQGASESMVGSITVGIIPTIAPYILPNLLTLAKKNYPDLELRIIEDQTTHLLHQLKEGRIDCAVVALPTNEPTLTEIPLYDEKFVMITPTDHELSGRKDLTLENLKDIDLILLEDGHCLRDQIVDVCRQVEVDPESSPLAHTRAASLTTVMQLVSAGLGGTLVPESAVEIEASRPGIAIAEFASDITAERHVGMVYRASSSRSADYILLGEMVTQAFEKSIQN